MYKLPISVNSKRSNKRITYIVILSIGIFLFFSNMDLNAFDRIELYEEDIFFFDELINKGSINDKSLLNTGYQAYKSKAHELSIKNFEDFLMKNINDNLAVFIAAYYIGKNYFQLGKYNDAIRKFDAINVIELKEYNHLKHIVKINTAISYSRLNDVSQFQTILRRVIKEDTLGKYGDYARGLLVKYNLPTEERMTVYEAAMQDEKEHKKEAAKEEAKVQVKKEIPVTVGMDIGQNIIISSYCKGFSNQFFIKPYILIYVLNFFGLSFNFEYFATRGLDTDNYHYAYLDMLNASFDGVFFVRFLNYYKIILSPGFGLAQTTFTRYSPAYWSTKSLDPYLIASLALGCDINRLNIKFGMSYKRVLIINNADYKYINKDLILYSIFGGVGYNF